jgi:hypothetical protein
MSTFPQPDHQPSPSIRAKVIKPEPYPFKKDKVKEKIVPMAKK